MKNLSEKEYHPVIENYISDYIDETLENSERDAFEEVLVYDDDLRELAFSAKEGKKLIQSIAFVSATEDFKKRLAKYLDNRS